MIRFLDLVFSLLGLLFGFPILLFLFLIGLFNSGSPLFFSEAIGP